MDIIIGSLCFTDANLNADGFFDKDRILVSTNAQILSITELFVFITCNRITSTSITSNNYERK